MSCGGRPTSLIAWPRASAVECDGGKQNYCGKDLVRVPLCAPQIPRYFITGVVWSPDILVTPAHNFSIYSVLKVHQLVDCLPSDLIDRWHVMSLRPADLTTRSRPSPTQMVRLSSSGRPSQCNRCPPPTRCPGLLYDFKSKLSERFQEVGITWPISAWLLKRICAVCCILRSLQFHPCVALYVFRVNCAWLCNQH